MMKQKLIGMVLALALMVGVVSGCYALSGRAEEAETVRYPYVFVHGINGFGEDATKSNLSYFGATAGNLVASLRTDGYECIAPSLSPLAGAWDCACELYAQLTGTRVDYGEAHSAKAGHARYGTQYTTPLVPEFGKQHKINLVGHSFGGTMIRQFSSLMAYGDEAEQKAAREAGEALSPLFGGGSGDWIFSITTIAAPHNGVTLLEILDVNPIFSLGASLLSLPNVEEAMSALGLAVHGMSLGDIIKAANTFDTAYYDLTPTGAKKLNESVKPNPEAYHFSLPVDGTNNGTPTMDMMIPIQVLALMIGKYQNPANGIDERWKPNDGLVNTISATAPFSDESEKLSAETLEEKFSPKRGLWYVLPTIRGDHASVVGYGKKLEEIQGFYRTQLDRIEELQRSVQTSFFDKLFKK